MSEIRLAEAKDLESILEIYHTAREFMRQSGNAHQWGVVYPPRAMLENDVCGKQLYVCCNGNAIHGVFAFMIGDDPTYSRIDNGAWRHDEPYGAIHRVASDGTVKGVFSDCLDYCKHQADYLRIDTHERNLVMRHLLIKHGFEERGVIYVEDDSPRIAYEYAKGQANT